MSIDNALATPYEFEFRGTHYRVSRIVQSIKGRLHTWLKQRLLREARECLSPQEYAEIRTQILAGDGGVSDPKVLLASLSSRDGSRFLLRCCLTPEVTDPETLDAIAETDELKAIYDLLAGELKADPKAVAAAIRG